MRRAERQAPERELLHLGFYFFSPRKKAFFWRALCARGSLAARSWLARGSRGPGENAQSVSDTANLPPRIREKSHLEGRAPTRTHGTHRHCDTLTRACATNPKPVRGRRSSGSGLLQPAGYMHPIVL